MERYFSTVSFDPAAGTISSGSKDSWPVVLRPDRGLEANPAPWSFDRKGRGLLAWFPCQVCDQPIAGEARNTYLKLFRGTQKLEFNFKSHEACQEELTSGWFERALRRGPDGQWALPKEEDTLESLWTHSEGPQRPRSAANGSDYLPWDRGR
jgi:hypothetical protein